MFPSADPTSQIGQLQSQIDFLKNEINRKVNDYDLHNKADQQSLDSTNDRLADMEHTIGQIRTDIDELLSWRQELQEVELIE